MHEINIQSNEYWDQFSNFYNDNLSRMNFQATSIMHDHLDLPKAQCVLETASGNGDGSKDILRRLPKHSKFHATDFSTEMVESWRNNVNLDEYDVQIKHEVSDAMDLASVESASMDRYISGLCLHLVPDPDRMIKEAVRVLRPNGIAGFTITGKFDNCGVLKIQELALASLEKREPVPIAAFEVGQDLSILKKRFLNAGFQKILVWPVLCLLGTFWSCEQFEALVRKWDACNMEKHPEEYYEFIHKHTKTWIDGGCPIGVEVYVIIAKV